MWESWVKAGVMLLEDLITFEQCISKYRIDSKFLQLRRRKHFHLSHVFKSYGGEGYERDIVHNVWLAIIRYPMKSGLSSQMCSRVKLTLITGSRVILRHWKSRGKLSFKERRDSPFYSLKNVFTRITII